MKAFLSELRLYICNHVISKIPSHRIRKGYYIYIMKFQLNKGVGIHLNCSFNAAKHLVAGVNSVINGRCIIDTRGSITIGKNVSISSDVIILSADHDMHSKEFSGRAKPVIIHDYVWIGTRAMILPGVTLGYGCVVAAGAVVTRDIKPFDVVAGVPAKKIGERNSESDFNYSTSYKRLFH